MIGSAAGVDGATITTAVLSGTESSGSLGGLLFALVWIIVGTALLVTFAREPIVQAWRYVRMDDFDPETATDEGGLVAVSGTVVDSDGTVTGPMSNEPCVAFEWKDQKFRNEYRYDRAERNRRERSSMHTDEGEIRS